MKIIVYDENLTSACGFWPTAMRLNDNPGEPPLYIKKTNLNGRIWISIFDYDSRMAGAYPTEAEAWRIGEKLIQLGTRVLLPKFRKITI